MSALDLILGKLEQVRKAGKGFRARCPLHGGGRDALVITEADDGRLLLKCFALCDTGDVLAAIGLTVSDLFPERSRDHSPEARQEARRARQEADWCAALAVLSMEAGFVRNVLASIHNGDKADKALYDRLGVSIKRIEQVQKISSARVQRSILSAREIDDRIARDIRRVEEWRLLG